MFFPLTDLYIQQNAKLFFPRSVDKRALMEVTRSSWIQIETDCLFLLKLITAHDITIACVIFPGFIAHKEQPVLALQLMCFQLV